LSLRRKIKILSVFGTRPEAIKMAPLVKKLSLNSAIISKVLATAQHRQMLDQVMQGFDIRCDFDLDVMRENQSLTETTQRVLERITPILEFERPDMVLVHGDTATTASASLAAYYLKIPCGHVEAGLRTGDKYAPFPEEIMRKIADVISDVHFAPTLTAKKNLLNEGIPEKNIFVTGNTAIDALLLTVKDNYVFKEERLNHVDFRRKKSIVVEVHRRENFGEGMENIAKALATIAEKREDVQLLVSVHRNPNAREPIERHLSHIPRTMLFDPLDYPDYVNLMKRSYLIVSDSGGVQEEAPSLGVPVVLCRDKTERPEAVSAGTVALVGAKRDAIIDTVWDLLDNNERYEKMAKAKNPFGDGQASRRIVEALLYWFGFLPNRPDEFHICN